MADADDIKEQQDQQEQQEQQEPKDSKADKTGKKSLITRLLPWLIMLVVVLVCTGAGFKVGRLFAGPSKSETAETSPKPESPAQTEQPKADKGSSKESDKVWYYELDPVVANLNEPTVTRYVRATLTLEMSADMDAKKGTAFLDEKKPILINWLTVYLSSLSLDEVRGDKNLRSIQSHIRDAFNEQLFPDSRSPIKQVLIKEFPIQ